MAVRYDVVITRDESGSWIAEVPSVAGCHTYGRSIRQAKSRIREALSLWVEDAAEAELVSDIRLAPELRKAARAGIRARARADLAQATARSALDDAARQLTSAGLSRRDVATLLDVSHQRIQQLLDGS